MGIRRLPAIALRGDFQLAFVALLTLVPAWVFPPFGWISGAFVTLALLHRGGRAALRGMLLAALIFAGILVLLGGQSLGALALPLVYWLPPLLPAWVLRRFVNLPLALLSSALLCVVAIALFHLLSDPPALWRELVNVRLAAAEELNPGLEAVNLRALLHGLSDYITGGIASLFFLFSLVSLMLARAWQSQLFNPGGLSREYLELRFGRIAAAAAILILVLGLTEPLFFANVGILVVFLFAVQGAAALHALAGARGLGGGAIFIIYGLLLASILLPLILQFYALVGLFDNWVDFRTRFGRKPD